MVSALHGIPAGDGRNKRLSGMSKRGNSYDSENRVNILKKVKISKNWLGLNRRLE
jgi:hypothetical protein